MTGRHLKQERQSSRLESPLPFEVGEGIAGFEERSLSGFYLGTWISQPSAVIARGAMIPLPARGNER